MRVLVLLVALLLACRCVQAAPVPSTEKMQQLLGPPQIIEVIEPHLSRQGHEVRVSYRGWPAPMVLERLLGAKWQQDPAKEIELRALDGFVSRIPVARFSKYKAWLVTSRVDGGEFLIDVPLQQEKRVPLGPWYLLWDNIAAPELVAEGGALWPYQVAAVALRPSSQQALLPGAMASNSAHVDAAALIQKHCLACHQINGYGGDKMPINLAERARQIKARQWQQWLIAPQSLKLGTQMPALPDTLPLKEREQIAAKLHRYLNAVPVRNEAESQRGNE